MSLRDELRSATLGKSPVFAEEKVDIGDGKIITVRQMTVGERSKRSEEASTIDSQGNPKIDMLKFNNVSIINSCYDEQGQRVFEEADMDVLASQPCGGWYDKLVEAITRLSNVEQTAQKN